MITIVSSVNIAYLRGRCFWHNISPENLLLSSCLSYLASMTISDKFFVTKLLEFLNFCRVIVEFSSGSFARPSGVVLQTLSFRMIASLRIIFNLRISEQSVGLPASRIVIATAFPSSTCHWNRTNTYTPIIVPGTQYRAIRRIFIVSDLRLFLFSPWIFSRTCICLTVRNRYF